MTKSKRVYFMKPVGMVGPIKIGCTMLMERRLNQVTSWSPFPLELVYEEVGGHDVERNLHCYFADLHFHHEWFHPGRKLLRALDRLKAGETISQVLDLTGSMSAVRPMEHWARSRKTHEEKAA